MLQSEANKLYDDIFSGKLVVPHFCIKTSLILGAMTPFKLDNRRIVLPLFVCTLSLTMSEFIFRSGANITKLFYVIYATSTVFPYYFD
jgi:hypothetical protein